MLWVPKKGYINPIHYYCQDWCYACCWSRWNFSVADSVFRQTVEKSSAWLRLVLEHHPCIHFLLPLLLQLILLLSMFQPSYPDKLPVYRRKENNHSLLQLTQSSRLTSRACLWKPERNQADRWRTRQPHTHHKEKLPDLVDQTCDTRVAPLEHQSLFKVFLPNLNRTREAHLRQVYSHTKRNIQQTLPHSQFHLLLCDAETKRKRKKKHTTHTRYILHVLESELGVIKARATHSHAPISWHLFVSHTLHYSAVIFFSPPPPPRAHLLPSSILICWQERRDKNTARTANQLHILSLL